MENQSGKTNQTESEPQSQSGETPVEKMNISFGAAQNAQGNEIIVRQGGIREAKANHIQIRQGGILRSNTDQLEIVEGGIGFSQSKSAQLTASRVGGMLIQGNTVMDQSASRVIVASGDVTMDQSASALLVARKVRAENSGVVFMIAQQIEGEVKPVFGPREAAVFGAAAGIAAGTVILLSRLVRIPFKMLKRKLS